jgi:hypothetical protein
MPLLRFWVYRDTDLGTQGLGSPEKPGGARTVALGSMNGRKQFQPQRHAIEIVKLPEDLHRLRQVLCRGWIITPINHDAGEIDSSARFGFSVVDVLRDAQRIEIARPGAVEISGYGGDQAQTRYGKRFTARIAQGAEVAQARFARGLGAMALGWNWRQEQEDIEEHLGSAQAVLNRGQHLTCLEIPLQRLLGISSIVGGCSQQPDDLGAAPWITQALGDIKRGRP